MPLFLHAHATHPDADWRLRWPLPRSTPRRGDPRCIAEPTLGWFYLTDHYAGDADALLARLQARWPGVALGRRGRRRHRWRSGVEYFDEPALSLMLADLPRGALPRVLGRAAARRRLRRRTRAGACRPGHPRPRRADRRDGDAHRQRLPVRRPRGGRARARCTSPTACSRAACRASRSTRDVALVSRVTQGCQPVGPVRRVTAAERNVITDARRRAGARLPAARPAASTRTSRASALPQLRQTLVGLSDAATPTRSAHAGQFGTDTLRAPPDRHRSARRGIAIGDVAEPGMQLAFCQRNAEAARRDLVRICAEIREELEPETLPLDQRARWRAAARTPGGGGARRRIAGAVYVSCAGRGGPHFGAPSAELADRAACARRCAAGGLLRGGRDRAPPPVRLHRRADGVRGA